MLLAACFEDEYSSGRSQGQARRALYIRKNIFSVSCIYKRQEIRRKARLLGVGVIRQQTVVFAGGFCCVCFAVPIAHAMPKGVPDVSLFIWEKEGTPWHDVTRCTPVHRIPNPNVFVFFSARGTREQACRAVRGAGAKCTARCFRPETQARFAQHGVGCEYYGHLRSEIGKDWAREPPGREKERRLVFFSTIAQSTREELLVQRV